MEMWSLRPHNYTGMYVQARAAPGGGQRVTSLRIEFINDDGVFVPVDSQNAFSGVAENGGDTVVTFKQRVVTHHFRIKILKYENWPAMRVAPLMDASNVIFQSLHL